MNKLFISIISIVLLISAGFYFWNAKKEKITVEEREKRIEEHLKQERPVKSEKQKEIDSAEEITLSEDELKQYYSSYENPLVLHIRKALNGYLSGTNEGMESPDFTIEKLDLGGAPAGLAAFDKEYYKSKFVVLAIDDALYGGKDVLLIFQDKPDKIFTAWVYELSDGNYDFRGLRENLEATEKIDLTLKTFGKYISDKEHSL